DEGGDAAPAAEKPRKRYVFTESASAAKLKDVKWETAGDAFHKLMPLLLEANEIQHGRKEMRPQFMADIFAAISPLYSVGTQIDEQGVAWTSPVVQINMLAATLMSAGQPVQESQFEPLNAVGSRFVEADAQRLARYADDTLALRKRVDASQLLGRLYAEIEPVLNEAQRAVLWPPAVRGIVNLDPFSAGAGWDEYMQMMAHGGRDALQTKMVAHFTSELELPEDQVVLLKQIVGAWVQALPDAFVLAKTEGPAARDVDMQKTTRVLAAAEHQVRLMQSVRTGLQLTKGQLEALVEMDYVLVPVLRKG
ncbi:MAG: hypothetical protein AAGD14_08635, partial [Planctomycetota bacterium]